MKHESRRLRSWLSFDVRQKEVRMRSVFILGFVGVLTVLLWIYAQSTRHLEYPGSYQPSREGAVLSIRELKPSERVLIIYQRLYRHDPIERQYQVEGGPPLRFAVKDIAVNTETEVESDKPLFGLLTPEEAFGLDAYLLFLRRTSDLGRGGHRDADIAVGYFRAGVKIGEERFRDDTGMLSGFRFENGRWSLPNESPAPFPLEVFQAIVPPWVIEQRLKWPNKAPEPTPTAVTPRADVR